MKLQRQHFLLSYLKTPSVGLTKVSTCAKVQDAQQTVPPVVDVKAAAPFHGLRVVGGCMCVTDIFTTSRHVTMWNAGFTVTVVTGDQF